MPITFAPRPGTVLICDFTTGFIPPEMVRRRPVIVLSPRRHGGFGPYCVVPVSTTRPRQLHPYHVCFARGVYRFPRFDVDQWVKCDLIATVAPARLERLRLNGEWIAPAISRADFQAVQRGVLYALGL